MLNQELIAHIKNQLQKGVAKSNIEDSLLSAGWREKDIEEGFVLAPSFVSLKTIKQSKTPYPIIQPANLSDSYKGDDSSVKDILIIIFLLFLIITAFSLYLGNF